VHKRKGGKKIEIGLLAKEKEMGDISNTGATQPAGGGYFQSGSGGGKMDLTASSSPAEQVMQIAETSGEEALAFFQGAMNPQGINNAGKIIVPANNRGIQTVVKPVTVYGNFASVPGWSGAVIWLIQNGSLSVHMYRLFPLGAPVPVQQSLTTPTFGLYNIAAVLTANMFVPCVADEDVRLEPAIENTFTMGRPIAGTIRLKSDATSTTSAAMSGTASAGAINDTRTAGDFSAPVLAQQSVTKKDGIVDSKIQDGIVALIGPDIAPDFTPINWTRTYSTSRSALLIDLLDGQVLSGQNTSSAQPYGSTGGPAAAWLSPYITLIKATPNSNLILPIQKGQRDAVVPIGLEDSPEVWINCFVDLVVPAPSGQQTNVLDNLLKYPPIGYKMAGAVWVIHYFMNNLVVNSTTPTLQLVSLAERFEVSDSVSTQYFAGLVQSLYPTTIQPTQPPSGAPQPGLQTATTGSTQTQVPMINGGTALTGAYYRIPQKFRSQPIRPAYTMWVGSFVQTSSTGGEYQLLAGSALSNALIAAGAVSMTGGADSHGFPTTANSQVETIALNLPTYTSVTEISIIGSRVYEPGAIGPCRVIRFDNVAKGQNILVGGTIYVEAIPSGNIAPFYSNASNAVQSTQCNYVDLLALLCNGDNETFKRVYTCSQYDHLIDYLKILGQPRSILEKWQDLNRKTNNELSTHKAIMAAKAGGFLDALRSAASRGMHHAMEFGKGALNTYNEYEPYAKAAYGAYKRYGGHRNAGGAMVEEVPDDDEEDAVQYPGLHMLADRQRRWGDGEFPMKGVRMNISRPAYCTEVQGPDAYWAGQPSFDISGVAGGSLSDSDDEDEHVNALGSFGASLAVEEARGFVGARIPNFSTIMSADATEHAIISVTSDPALQALLPPDFDPAKIGISVPTGFLVDPMRAVRIIHKLYELKSHRQNPQLKRYFGDFKAAVSQLEKHMKTQTKHAYMTDFNQVSNIARGLQAAISHLHAEVNAVSLECVYEPSKRVDIDPVVLILAQPLSANVQATGDQAFSVQVFFGPGGLAKVKSHLRGPPPKRNRQGEMFDSTSLGVLFANAPKDLDTPSVMAGFLGHLGTIQLRSMLLHKRLKVKGLTEGDRNFLKQQLEGLKKAMAHFHGAGDRPVSTFVRNVYTKPSIFYK
jgi:hypothetical protein